MLQNACTCYKIFNFPARGSGKYNQGLIKKFQAGAEGSIENFLPEIDCSANFSAEKARGLRLCSCDTSTSNHFRKNAKGPHLTLDTGKMEKND